MAGLTIVCAIDMSACSRRALQYAAALADHFGARLMVLHVKQPGVQDPGFSVEKEPDGVREFVARAAPLAAPWAQPLEVDLRLGHPGREILAFASEWADLLVMGTRGETGIQTAFLGSTTEHALRRSPIPVLSVPPAGSDGDEPLVKSGPILVPIDFSAPSVSAARIASGIADALSIPLLLVHVVPEPAAMPAHGIAHVPATAADAQQMLGNLATLLKAQATIDVVVRQGHRRAEIARLAVDRRASFIVMSLKGQPAPIGTRGSSVVVYNVMCGAPVPVLALPRGAWHAFPHPAAGERSRLAGARALPVQPLG